MKILKIKLFQETACYKKPFAFKVAETYPLPPYSTIIGMFHKILQANPGQYFPMAVSVQGCFDSIFTNYQNLRMYKKDKITTMPRNVHQLLNVNLVLHVQAQDDIIDQLYQNILEGKESFTLGRNEDLVRLDEVKVIEVHKEKRKILKYNTYIPNADEEIHGIYYRLNTVYKVENKVRVWEKQDVKYVEKGEEIEDVLLDEEGDSLFLCMSSLN